jgi:hypothetical protein
MATLAIAIALGIALAAASGANADESPRKAVTWKSDIAPLLRTHCTDCHQPGGAAPFSLLQFQDAFKRRQFLLDVTESGLMPPWKADPTFHSFANERLLPPEDLDLLRRWVASGAPEGDSIDSDNEGAPSQGFSAKRTATVAPAEKPDLILRMSRPFVIPAGDGATYICVKLPYEIPRDTFVRATDFYPGNRKLTHHASYQILAVADGVDTHAGPEIEVYASANDGTPNDAPNDARQYEYFKLNAPDGTPPVLVFHTGWLPGTSPQRYPPGMGFRLPKRGVLLIRSLHFSPTPVEAFDQSEVRLWFARGPVERKVEFAAFKPESALVPNRKPMFLPANRIVKHEINNTVPMDVSLLAINPHMHLLGRSFKVYAVKPDGDTVPLVYIPAWDFNWQEFYRFRELIKLPKGSLLHAEAWYDNTRKNPHNPFIPPRDVYFERGMADTDEMMRLVILYVPWKPGDEGIVQER